MGCLHYGDRAFPFEDRTLLHLQLVIGTKLRRGESFFLSWAQPGEGQEGRVSAWMDPGIPLVFEFAGTRSARLNTDWLRQLTDSSNSGGGLFVSDEPVAGTAS